MGKKAARGFLTVFLSVLSCLALSRPVRAQEVVTAIQLEVENNVVVGKECTEDDIVVTPLNEGYVIWCMELLNTGSTWGTGDVPRFRLYIHGEEAGTTFSLTKEQIRINGAEMESARTDPGGEELVITIRLPSMRMRVGEIAEVSWGDGAMAVWSASYNASRYELRLIKDDELTGPVYTASGTEFNFGEVIRREGDYRFRVRAVNGRDERIKSEWKECGTALHVDAAMAESFYQQYSATDFKAEGPGVRPVYYEGMYGWIAEGDLWWYRNPDGSYTKEDWQLIDGKWYFFNSRGYMVTGWIQWNDNMYYCDPVSGAMLTNTVVPDGMGLRVDSSGALIR